MSAAQANVDTASLFAQARQAETELRLAQALSLYRRVIAAAPSGRLAARAEARVTWLSERAQNGFAPLVALLRIRKRLAKSASDADLAAFEAHVDRTFPQGLVRVEALFFIGNEWLNANRPLRAQRAFRRLLAQPGLTASDADKAATGLAKAHAAQGRYGQALELLEQLGHGHGPLAQSIRARQRRTIGEPVAWTVLSAFVTLALAFGGWRGFALQHLRATFALSFWFVFAFTLVVPLVLAAFYDTQATDTFAVAGLGATLVFLITSATSVGASRVRAGALGRRTLALGAVAAQVSVGYLALERSGLALSVLP